MPSSAFQPRKSHTCIQQLEAETGLTEMGKHYNGTSFVPMLPGVSDPGTGLGIFETVPRRLPLQRKLSLFKIGASFGESFLGMILFSLPRTWMTKL